MSRITCIALLTFLFSGVTAQKEFNKWYFGRYAGLDFNTPTPSVITHTTMFTWEGCSSISDANGNLLMYTDGSTIWNGLQQVMANGTGLFGNGTTVQAAIIARKPASSSLYYVFTLDGQGGANGLRYSIVDMTLAAGMGSVTVKNIPITTPCTEQLSGVRHCNGVDLWIVTHDFSSNQFKAYLLTSAGLNTTAVVSAVGPTPPIFVPNNLAYGQGAIKFSPSGKKLGLTFFNGNGASEIALFDFDRSTGTVSNYLSLLKNIESYSCEFSGDGSKFYGNTVQPAAIFQWDLCAGNDSLVKYSINTFTLGTSAARGMQLAPNGKIYAVTNYTYLSVIQNPNVYGVGCGISLNVQSVATGSNGTGLPSFIPEVYKTLPQFSYAIVPQTCASASFSAASTITTGCASSGYSVQSLLWIFPGAATSTLSTCIHNFGVPGTYPVKLVYKYQCGADTVYQNVLIPTQSVTISSNLCITPAQATVLVNASSGPYSYTWMPSMQTTQVATVTTGNYSITVVDAANNCTYTTAIQFTIPPTLSATAVSQVASICLGQTATLQATGFGGNGPYTYSWTNGPATAQNVVTPATVGVYTFNVKVSDLNNCSSFAFTTLSVNAVPNISAQSATVCTKQSTSLTATGALSYTWQPGSVNAQSIVVVSPTANQSYTVSGTNQNGCIGSVSVNVAVSKCLGISAQSDLSFLQVVPNPFSDEIRVTCTESSVLVICDLMGNEVLRKGLMPGETSISTENLSAGVYFLMLSNKPQTTLKLLKLAQ